MEVENPLITYKSTVFFDNGVDLSPKTVELGMRYDFTIFYKIRKSAGNHGLLFAYDATKFQLLEQRGITFKNLSGTI